MKRILNLALPVFLLVGCATSNVESRKKERYHAYSELPAEQRAAVDAGRIKVGMTMDAVYIAWGKPNQILAGETPAGAQVVWLYLGTQLQGYSYWGYQGFAPYRGPYGPFYGPMLFYDYLPVGYVKAEVIFEKDVVRQWRTLPTPGY
jgi:hypothetical protein